MQFAHRRCTMNLNLAILCEDLRAFQPQCGQLADPLFRPLRYVTCWAGERQLYENRLYLVQACELPEKASEFHLSGEVSLLCIGEPPFIYRAAPFRCIWTPETTSFTRLFSVVAERFQFYRDWENRIRDGIEKNEPPNQLARLSLPVFRKPLSLFSADFLVIFYEYNPRYGVPSYDYTLFVPGKYVPKSILDLWNQEENLSASMMEKRPYYYNVPGYPECLDFNIYFSDRHCATLQVERVKEPLTDRDYTLIEAFGMMLKNALVHYDALNFSVDSKMLSVTESLLAHKLLDYAKIETALENCGWNSRDPYVCAVIMPVRESLNTNLLLVLGAGICSELTDCIYVLAGGNLLFIQNLARLSSAKRKAQKEIFYARLQDAFLFAGISTIFSEYADLYYYYQSALYTVHTALADYHKKMVQEGADSHTHLFYYQDFMLRNVFEKSLKNTVVETCYPVEYLRVKEYDRIHGTSYEKVLHSMLHHSLNTTAVAEELFLHRNTVFLHTKRLKEFFHIDLKDSDTRLLYALLFQMEAWCRRTQ